MDASVDDIWFLNRTLALVRARPRFFEWLRSLPDDEGEPLSDPRPTGYLIPEADSEEEAWAWLEAEWATLFEMELEGWVIDPALWPEGRSWTLFREWFEVELVDLVWDLVDAPLSSQAP
jgi:hypothetical protein